MSRDSDHVTEPDAIAVDQPQDVKLAVPEDGAASHEARVSEMELNPRPRVKAEEMEAKMATQVESPSAGEGEAEKGGGSQYSSLLSEFDELVASEKSGQIATSRALRFGLEIGDMVWGKVKSHPWWPGHIFSDAFASPQVRRLRKEGHVLVAFFGDSSYGWFDPAELIPFEANFAEKSSQTVSRTFSKSVEEAIDEASRRRCVGLACRCRCPYSFLPATVKGYFTIDVPDYEPRAVYSTMQIQKSRDSFKPSEALSFIKNLALSPCNGDDKDLDFVMRKAEVVAYRKAVFEEYDDTYAEAFSIQTGRPARDRNEANPQPSKQPPRAPLSGPLVIAETLGSGGTGGAKQAKVKDGSKKEKYLLKRRDESGGLKSREIKVAQGISSAPLASPGGFAAQASLNGRKADSFATQGVSGDTIASLDKSKVAVDLVAKEELESGRDSSSYLSGNAALSSVTDGSSESMKQENQGLIELKREELTSTDENCGKDRVKDGINVEMSAVSGVRKMKEVKRPREELNSENSKMEGKKKKMKKQSGAETSFRDPNKKSIPKKVCSSAGKILKKRVHPPKEELKEEQSKRNNGNGSSNLSPFAVVGETEFNLPRLLRDLHELALDPFHGIERRSPTLVKKFFFRFRSLVYEKSLALSPPSSETEPNADPRPLKPASRSDDPSVAGRKRAPSDRQEENAAKRSKKVSDIRTLAAEKKTAPKSLEPQRAGESRESAVPLGRKSRPDSAKKPPESSGKSSDPTMLVMKFPPMTTLPSAAELKARFARFGPMDQSALRVFWKTLTCRIVFLRKADAQAACKFAAANGSSVFGTQGLRCYVRDFGAAGADDNPADPVRANREPLPPVQLKSCLKKPAPDEPAPATGRAAPRVKFMLAGEESTVAGRVEISPVVPPPLTSSTTSSISVAMDVSVEKVVSQTPLPLPLPIPSSSSLYAKNNPRHHDVISMGPGNRQNSNVDISQQMMSLLTRCNDVVANVSSLLGYVPYHSL